MKKNLKLSFILYFIIGALLISWRTLLNFFGGAGVAFVAMLGITISLLLLILFDKSIFNRTIDLFILTCAFTIFEFIIYVAFEFNINSFNSMNGFLIIQNILSILALLFVAYVTFRLITELKNVKITFVEVLLGNEKPSKKAKKAKEITNGALEDKPKNLKEEIKEEIVVETEQNPTEEI